MIAAGEERSMTSGLEAIFLENRASLLRFLRARGAGDESEDLLQEIWMRLSEKTLGPVADPLPYLYRMANNLMLDRHRSRVRREKREQDWTEDTVDTATGAAPDAPADDRLIHAQSLSQVEAALRALGPRVEMVLRRFRLEGVGQKQIAEELGVSLTTVEKDLQKAYRALMTLKAEMDAQ